MSEQIKNEINIYDTSLYLKNIFIDHLQNDAKYSVRTFARDLGVSPAYISQVLSYKRKISIEMGLKIRDRNFLDQNQCNVLIKLIELEHCKNSELKEVIRRQISDSLSEKIKKKYISYKNFSLISEWYNFAIIELLKTNHKPKSIEDIAKKFNISSAEALHSVETLLMLGYIKKDGLSFTPDLGYYETGGVPSKTIRRCHKQLIKKGMNAIDEQTFSNRIIMARTIAFRKSDLSKVNEIIDRFYSEISELSVEGEFDSVYQVNTQFFQLDHVKLHHSNLN